MIPGFWALDHTVYRALCEGEVAFGRGRSPLPSVSGSAPARAQGATIIIKVEGVLTPRAHRLARALGFENTSYLDLVEAMDAARNDRKVESVVFEVDSPGGAVDGLYEAISAAESLRSSGKTTRVRARHALSAAYMLAAAAGPIEATSPAASFGSVGIVAALTVDPSTVEITNRESPDKRPNPATPGGKSAIQRQLDAFHALFAEAIARGRKTTTETVNARYGRGATLLARSALTAGMIDSLGSTGAASLAAPLAGAFAVDEEMAAADRLCRSFRNVEASAQQASPEPDEEALADELLARMDRAWSRVMAGRG